MVRMVEMQLPSGYGLYGYVLFWRNRSTATVVLAASASQARSRARAKQKRTYGKLKACWPSTKASWWWSTAATSAAAPN